MKSVHVINGLHLFLDANFISTYEKMVDAIDNKLTTSLEGNHAPSDSTPMPKKNLRSKKNQNSPYNFDSEHFVD